MVTQSANLRLQAVDAARRLLEQQPVFLDTETTGLDMRAEIIEISVLDCDGTPLFESLLRPTKPIPADATRIHHITDAMVQSAPTWPVIWPTLRSLLVSRTIAIYNEDYDVRLMRQTHGVYRLPWRETFKTTCLMRLYAQYQGMWDSRRRSYRLFSLEAAGQQCRLPQPNTHRSGADCQLSRALLLHMAGAPNGQV